MQDGQSQSVKSAKRLRVYLWVWLYTQTRPRGPNESTMVASLASQTLCREGEGLGSGTPDYMVARHRTEKFREEVD